jgi:hypothetical protein
MTDYRKWDHLDVSSDEEEEAARSSAQHSPRTLTKPVTSADAETIVQQLAKAELLGEEILADRQQVVELDRRRNQNREALASFRRAERQGEDVAQKQWMCMGDVFIRRPKETAIRMLEEDQRRIERELDALRAGIKRKTSLLCDLDPTMCAPPLNNSGW